MPTNVGGLDPSPVRLRAYALNSPSGFPFGKLDSQWGSDFGEYGIFPLSSSEKSSNSSLRFKRADIVFTSCVNHNSVSSF